MDCLKWEKHLNPPDAGHMGTLKLPIRGAFDTLASHHLPSSRS